MDSTLVNSKSSHTRRKNSSTNDPPYPRKRPRCEKATQPQPLQDQPALTPRGFTSSLHRVSLSPSPDNDGNDGNDGAQSSAVSLQRRPSTVASKRSAPNTIIKAPAAETTEQEPVRRPSAAITGNATLSHPFDKYHLSGGPPPLYRSLPQRINDCEWNVSRIVKATLLCICVWSMQAWYISARNKSIRQKRMAMEFPHILRPKKSRARINQSPPQTSLPLTLRQVLTDTEIGYHLAMAPAFFGFYGYFGALVAWENATTTIEEPNNTSLAPMIRSVAGASAGAMAAVLLASGISPRQAADFCTTIQWHQFADFPGVGAVFRGNKFEQTMRDFMHAQQQQRQQGAGNHTDFSSFLLLEQSKIPVAVTAFDLQTMQGRTLTQGSMARAARASATFPFLFQPVGWTDAASKDYVFVDGGIADMHGMMGMETFLNQVPAGSRQRVINLKVGAFRTRPPGPSTLSIHGQNDTVVEVVTVSLQNLPQPGPWALEKGPVAVEAARQAMLASLDVPLFPRSEEHHYELHIDTSYFWEP